MTMQKLTSINMKAISRIAFITMMLFTLLCTGCKLIDSYGPAATIEPTTALPTEKPYKESINLDITPEPEIQQELETPPPETTPEPEATPYTAPVIANLPSSIKNPYPSSYRNAYNEDGTLKNDRSESGYVRNTDFQPPTAHTYFDIRQFNGYYLGDITQKVVYLTLDEGYEYGYTPAILDTLKDKGVKAAFFVTKDFIKSSPDLCIRMVEEGHIVGNHTANHKTSWELTDEEFIYEVTETARYFKEVTGYDMDMYFRFPEGEYSARVLSIVNDLGYKAIFWSLHYLDYDHNNQPGKQYAFNFVTTHFHNGCIMLLHAKSESNTEALGDIIDYIRTQGYTFETLDNLPDY